MEQNRLIQNILDTAYLANLSTPSNDKLDESLPVNPLAYIPPSPILYTNQNAVNEISSSINPEITTFSNNLFYPEHFI